MADELVGRVQDVAEAAVVLLQLDLLGHAEFAHKVGHVANPRAAEGVNALVVVAHRQHAAAGHDRTGCQVLGAVAGEHLDPGVLQLVGVLELVDQDVTKAALVVFSDGILVA